MLFELAKESRMHENITVRQTLHALSVCWDDNIAEDLEQLLTLRVFPRKTINPFHPEPQLKAEFMLGESSVGNTGVSREQLAQGMLIVGRSGAGKTTLLYGLFRQFMAKNVPVLALDFKKDYRHLAREYQDLIVIPWEYLRFNPLKPPDGVSPIRWLQDLAEVFSHSNALLSGSKNFFMIHLHKLYEMYGMFEGKDTYPSLFEFQELLGDTRYSLVTKDARYLETVRNRIDVLILALDKVLDCSDGFPISELLERNVVIELEGLAEDVQNFLTETILVWIYIYRLAQGHRGQLRHCILFDEAKRVFDRNKELNPASGIPIIDIITDRAREFGEALIVADQEPGKLTDSIKANTLTKIMLSLGSGKDISEMSHCMGLSEDQMDYSYKLGVGQGIMKIAGLEPLKINIPFARIDKNVTDEEVVQNLKKNTANFRISPRTPLPVLERRVDELADKTDMGQEMSKSAWQLLVDINKNSVSTLSERYGRLGLSACKGNKAKNELKAKGYVKEEEVKAGGKGGRPKLLEPTEKGNSHLLLNGEEPNGKTGKGSLKHRYWQQKIKEYFENWNCKAEIELFIGKKSIDVAVFCPNRKAIAVEIAMSPYYELENIKKDLGFGFDQIVVACRDMQTKALVEKACRSNFEGNTPEKVRFCLLKQFNGSGEPLDLDFTDSGQQYKQTDKQRNGPEGPEGE